MRILRRLCLLIGMVFFGLQGCVLGYGGCKLTDPVKTTLSGRVHFRDFRDDGGLDRAPILTLDRTEYIYSPGVGRQCRPALDMQLIPLTDLPDNIVAGAHVRVVGSIAQASQRGQHTAFVFNVTTVQLIK